MPRSICFIKVVSFKQSKIPICLVEVRFNKFFHNNIWWKLRHELEVFVVCHLAEERRTGAVKVTGRRACLRCCKLYVTSTACPVGSILFLPGHWLSLESRYSDKSNNPLRLGRGVAKTRRTHPSPCQRDLRSRSADANTIVMS